MVPGDDKWCRAEAMIERNSAIIYRAMQVRGVSLIEAQLDFVYETARSSHECHKLDPWAWELTFPRVFVWHKESKRKD